MRLSPTRDNRRHVSPDDQTLPLINIAFLLLIFFLLAGTLLPPSPFEVSELQLAEGVPGRDDQLRLLIAQDGRIAFGGAIIDRDAIAPELFAELQGPLSVHVDARAEAQMIVDLLRLLSQNGVVEVRLIGADVGVR